jgi:arsenate reductase
MASAPFTPELLVQQLQAVAQVSRLSVLRLLARYEPFGLAAGDIARLIAVPHNTLSTHLADLENAGLVRSRKDGRKVVYALDRSAIQQVLANLAGSLGARNQGEAPLSIPVIKEKTSEEPIYSVLVLCTANSARSIMAEALINREGNGRFRAFSAGAKPRGIVDPEVIRFLEGLGYEVALLQSKSWDLFSGSAAPRFDFLITVCDDATGEKCPHWSGHPLAVHWGVADPIAASATLTERREAIRTAYRQLSSRVTAFVNLPIERLALDTLKAELRAIGRLEGATELALAPDAA